MANSEIDNRIDALAAFVSTSPFNIEYTGNKFDYPDKYDIYDWGGDQFYVVTDEEADEMAKDEWYDQIVYGDDGDLFERFGDDVLDHLDQDWFEECCRDDSYTYAHDCLDEEELIQECLRYNIIYPDDLNEDEEYEGDLDELRDQLAEYLFERCESEYNGDFASWYEDEFGRSALLDRVDDGYVSIDREALVDYVINNYDRGEALATYDYEENYQDGYYIYQVG